VYIKNLGETTPLVSIVVPAYNADRFVERTLKSILNQTYFNLEILLIDDGSTDKTNAIAQIYAESDSRLTIYQQPKSGVAAARNIGIKKAKGEFIALLDADDIWESTNIEKQLRALLTADDTVSMVYSWSADIDEFDYLTGGVRISSYHGNIYPVLLYQNVIGNGSACMFRRSCLVELGGYNTNFLVYQAQGCEDWDIYLRLAKNYQVAVVPEILVGYRQVVGSMSSQAVAMEKSRQLTLQPIREQYPLVYEKINRWTASARQIYEAKQYFKVHKMSEAWHSCYWAIRNDCAVIFTTYNNYTFFLKMALRSAKSSLARIRAADPQKCLNATSTCLKAPVNSSVKTNANRKRFDQRNTLINTTLSFWLQLKLYCRLALTPFFPVWLVHLLRIRWLTAQMHVKRSEVKELSFWISQLTKAKIQLLSTTLDRKVYFGKDMY